MQNQSDRHQNQYQNQYQNHAVSTVPPLKWLGDYLVEAGLLSLDQINVILNDQQATGMRFGEIAVARGWLKEQTIEWIVEKVIEPERQRSKSHQTPTTPPVPQVHSTPINSSINSSTNSQIHFPINLPITPPIKSFTRREAPIAKPLPSITASDNEVPWVG